MKSLQKIMVAIDFSEDSISAASYAVGLAKDVGAQLLLTSVINQRDVDMMNKVALRAPDFDVQKHIGERKSARKERLQDLAAKINPDQITIETKVRIGVPYKTLLLEIQEQKPDMLIMGTKGRSEIIDMVIGSCAQKMFRRCPIPLLSLRSNQPSA